MSLPSARSFYGDQLHECHLPFNFALVPWNASWTGARPPGSSLLIIHLPASIRRHSLAARPTMPPAARGPPPLRSPHHPQSVAKYASVLLTFSAAAAKRFKSVVSAYLDEVPQGGWPNWVLGNHDNSRVATRLGSEDAARMAATLLLTLPGTPTVYFGDELSMPDVPVPDDQARRLQPGRRTPKRTYPLTNTQHACGAALTTPGACAERDDKIRPCAPAPTRLPACTQVKDPAALRQPKELWGVVGRDPERSPMSWAYSPADPSAGFLPSNATRPPWLPQAQGQAQANVSVAQQSADRASSLSHFKRLTLVRAAIPALRGPRLVRPRILRGYETTQPSVHYGRLALDCLRLCLCSP